MKPFKQLIQDGWANLLTGLGTTQDRNRYTRYVAPCERDESELNDLYRSNWLARKVVEALPARAFARGVSEATKLPEQFDALNYARWDEGAFLRACYLGRLHGGAKLLIGCARGGEDLTQPAPTSGGVAFLDVMTRWELRPAQRPEGGEWRDQDPRSPTYQQVQVWEVQGQHRLRGLKIHESRFLTFGGVSKPPRSSGTARTSPDGGDALLDAYNDWSDSVLLPVWDDVRRYGTFWQSLDALVGVASVGVIKMKGLMNMLSQEDQATIRARIDIMNTSMSLTRNLMLDSEGGEDYSRTSVSFAGLPELSQEQQLAVAGAVGMPVTELFGRSPAGLNATGESDAQMWYDRVTEWRERVAQPRFERLCAAIAGQASFEVEFPPVEVPSEKEEAELRAAEISATERLWSMGAFSDQEIRDAMRKGEWVELLEGLKYEVPEDPTRAVVQVKSESEAVTTGGAPSGPAPRQPPKA